MTTSIVLLILLLYGAGMYLIGRRAKRRASSFQDTIAAPGQTTLLLLAGSAIGGQIGSGFVIGGAEYGARFGRSRCHTRPRRGRKDRKSTRLNSSHRP